MTAAANTPASTLAMMRAFAQIRIGGVEVLEEVQLPVPVPTGPDLLVRMEALGPQQDGRFQPGDAVFFAGNVARAGCQRQFTLVDSRLVGRCPRRLSAAEAAALPLTTLTV